MSAIQGVEAAQRAGFAGFRMPTHLTGNREVAIALCEAGVRVFPCRGGTGPDAKNPCPGIMWQSVPRGDMSRVEQWWTRWPDAMPGLNTVDHGVLFVDLDGDEGIRQWDELCARHGYTHTGPRTRTPGDPIAGKPRGWHVPFIVPEGVEIGNGLGGLTPKKQGGSIDVRSPGRGYVIGPGAENGGGGIYEPEDGDNLAFLGAPEMPAWLIGVLGEKVTRDESAPDIGNQISAKLATNAPTNQRTNARIEAWAEAAYEKEIDAVTNCGEGGRNLALNTAAFSLGQMVAGGYLDGGRVRAGLLGAASINGLVAEDGRKSVEATISSGMRGGLAKPRQPPAEMLDDVADDVAGRIAAAPALRARNGQAADPETGELVDQDAGRRADLDLLLASDLARRPVPSQHWLVEGMIPAGNVTLLSGDGGAGKSLLALQLAVAVATGGEWLNLQPKAGKVLFVSAEDELDELHRRLAKMEPDLGRLRRLVIAPLAGKDASLADPDPKTGALKRTPLFEKLRIAVDHHRPDLLVLDTLADLFGGDEIKKAHARSFIALLRELAFTYGVTVLLLSHPSLAGINSGTGTSGNVAWNNSVRSRLYLDRKLSGGTGRGDPIKEDDPDLRVLSLKKSNRAAVGGEIVARYCHGQFIREAQHGSGAVDRRRQAEGVFVALLSKFTGQNRTVSHSPSSTYAPKVFADHPEAAGLDARDLKHAMERLLEGGMVQVIRNPDLPPSKMSKIIVLASDPRVAGEADAGAFHGGEGATD